MPFSPHLRVTALGRLGSSPERFSYSLNMAPITSPMSLGILDGNSDVWQDLAADVRAFHVRPTSKIHSRAVLETVKIARIGEDGKYTADPVIVDVVDAPGTGPDSSTYGTMVPPQSALAISLETGRRGPSGKGRFYLPMPVIAVQDDLRVAQEHLDAVEASAAQLITDLGDQPGADVLDLRVVVASTKGFNTEVTGVRVGRVLDTIRSRRRSLIEDYSPSTSVNQGG